MGTDQLAPDIKFHCILIPIGGRPEPTPSEGLKNQIVLCCHSKFALAEDPLMIITEKVRSVLGNGHRLIQLRQNQGLFRLNLQAGSGRTV